MYYYYLILFACVNNLIIAIPGEKLNFPRKESRDFLKSLLSIAFQ